MDRRAIKSREAIVQAFLYLLPRKGFDKLTVREIADQAQLNRVTFYQHYKDKYDLLEQCAKHYVDEMLKGNMNVDLKSLIHRSFLYVQKHQEELLKLSQKEVVYALLDAFKKQLRDQYLPLITGNHLEDIMMNEIHAGMATGMLQWWIHHAQDYSVEEAVNSYMILRSCLFIS